MKPVSFGATILFKPGAISPGSMLPKGASFTYRPDVEGTLITNVPSSEVASTVRKLQDFYGYEYSVTAIQADDFVSVDRWLRSKG